MITAVQRIAKGTRIRAGDLLIVYSLATSRVRRIAVSDEDKVHDSNLHPGEGELHLPARYKGGLDLHAIQTYVNERTGMVAGGDRYVGINIRSGRIVEVSIRDPLCGDKSPPGMVHVRHDTADPAWAVVWTHDGPTFTAPAAPTYSSDQQAALARWHTIPRPTDWTSAERTILAGFGITV